MTVSDDHVGTLDFDFLFGSWHIVNERLKSRLSGSDEWERFEAVGECLPILGGIGNVDDFRPTWPGREGFEGASLRLFNPATGQWSIYWMDNVRCALFPPVMGSFVNGVGEFYGDDQHEGKPVLARLRWSDITADTARWEQAFSEDHGETWETNWIMTFTRQQAN
ncbi:MAG: hypothetical protein ACR2M3_02920 [Thermomicrobiales bacterium]